MAQSESGSASGLTAKFQSVPLAVAHFLLALFSLGYLGVAARNCAVDTCTAQLTFLVATGVISFVVAALLGLFFLLNTYSIIIWGWTLDLFLLVWWGVALGFTMHYIEALTTPYAQPFIAFAWCAIALSLFCFVISALGNPCCASKSYEEFDAEDASRFTSRIGDDLIVGNDHGRFGDNANGNGNINNNNNNNIGSGSSNTSQLPNSRGQVERQRDRDFVPEERYMSGNQGDPNYEAPNLVGRLAGHFMK